MTVILSSILLHLKYFKVVQHHIAPNAPVGTWSVSVLEV